MTKAQLLNLLEGVSDDTLIVLAEDEQLFEGLEANTVTMAHIDTRYSNEIFTDEELAGMERDGDDRVVTVPCVVLSY